MTTTTTAIDWSQPTAARVHNHWLGGKDNFATDREVADRMTGTWSALPGLARANRDFRGRAVRWAIGAGIRQFVDVGCGLPMPDGVHEIAQRLEPSARVLYVDNDPIVAAHSRALLVGTPAGRVDFLTADLAYPDQMVAAMRRADVLDPTEPVALLLLSVLEHVDDPLAEKAASTLVSGLPRGSWVAISHPAAEFAPDRGIELNAIAHENRFVYLPRSRTQVAGFLEGLDTVEPGITLLPVRHDGVRGAGGPAGRRWRDRLTGPGRAGHWVGMGRTRGV